MNASSFAREWIAAWNRGDVEAVLALYTDDVVFTSPTAQKVVGRGRVEGKADLRAYWTAALAQHKTLSFVLDRAIYDADARTLMIVYVSGAGGQPKRATELFRFDADGRIVEGEAFHGITL
jgi:uncharacterized protein (TIGR02246 family)